MQIVDRPRPVPFQDMFGLAVVGRQEDDRHPRRLFALLDHLSQFKTGHPRHLNVQHDQGKLFPDQCQQRVVGRMRAYQPITGITQHGFQHRQVFRFIIHQQDVDGVAISFGRWRYLGLVACSIQAVGIRGCGHEARHDVLKIFRLGDIGEFIRTP